MDSLSQAVERIMGMAARSFIGAVVRNPRQQQHPFSASQPSDDRPTLMSLPIEIRIMIAKYVVTSPDVLYFQWTTWENHRRAATFEQIKHLNALSQVNRQLYDETSSLVWKMNEFQIQEAYFGTAYICGRRSLAPSEPSAIFKALDFLIEHGPVERMSEVTLQLDLIDPMYAAGVLKTLTRLGRKAQHLHMTIIDTRWTVAFIVPVRISIQLFINYARNLHMAVVAVGLSAEARQWKVWPYVTREMYGILDRIGDREVMKWFCDGM